MKVTILDTKTGRLVETDDFFTAGWWATGNGSCDCNRDIEFIVGDDDFPEGVCHGSKRFLIVATSPKDTGYSLFDFNEDYPEELLRAHGIQHPKQK